MPKKHSPPRWLIITLVTIKCHPIRLGLFVFCKMTSCRRFITTLVTAKLDSFMNRQFLFCYTGSLHSFVVSLVTVISNLFMYGKFGLVWKFMLYWSPVTVSFVFFSSLGLWIVSYSQVRARSKSFVTYLTRIRLFSCVNSDMFLLAFDCGKGFITFKAIMNRLQECSSSYF